MKQVPNILLKLTFVVVAVCLVALVFFIGPLSLNLDIVYEQF